MQVVNVSSVLVPNISILTLTCAWFHPVVIW